MTAACTRFSQVCTSSLRCFSTSAVKSTLPVISFERVDQLLQKRRQIKAQFNKHGYLIFSAPSSNPDILYGVTRLFGKIQGHARSPLNGIVEVRSEQSPAQDTQVNSNLHFFAHTDGHYLEGLAHQQDRTMRVTSPKMIGLQCVKPASEGGVTFLVDGKAMLISMLKEHSHILTTLFSRNCISICREKHLIMDVPIYKQLPNGNFALRFSYDQDLYVSPQAKRDVDFFNKHYVSNPVFTTYLSLSERQILLVDNHRLLHGRTVVKGERQFRRIWVQDEDSSAEVQNIQREGQPYYGSAENAMHIMAAYQPYLGINDGKVAPFEKIVTLGITLPVSLKLKMQRIYKSQFNKF
jgi:hypothetical protein